MPGGGGQNKTMPAKISPYKIAAIDGSEKERVAELAAHAGLSVSNWFRRAAGLPLVEHGGARLSEEEIDERRTETARTPARPAK